MTSRGVIFLLLLLGLSLTVLAEAFNVQVAKRELKEKSYNLYYDAGNDVVPSLKCTLGKKEGNSRSVICDLTIEALTFEENTYRDFCRVTFVTQHEKVPLSDTFPSISAASRGKVVFSHVEKRPDNSEYLHVFHVVDAFSCESREVKIPLGRQSFSSMDVFRKTFQLTHKDSGEFDVIYQMSNLCESGICRKSFNALAESSEDVCSLTKQNLPFTGPLIFKNFYFLQGLNGLSKYLVILVQKVHHKPVLTLLEAGPEVYKTLGTFNFENHNFDNENLDVDLCHQYMAICLIDVQRYERISIIRCIQLDSNWNKILDTTVKLAYAVDLVKVKILSTGEIALLIHEERGDYYVRKIDNSKRMRTLVLEGLHDGSGVHGSDAITNFYESKHDNLCFSKLEHKNFRRACFSKKLLDECEEPQAAFT